MKRNVIIWAGAVGLVCCLFGPSVVAGWYILRQKQKMEDFRTQVEMEREKEALEREYADLALQYDQYEGSKLLINNDSLVEKLDAERMKVQRLLEELRTVKSTNTARINELKKEIETLRGIMRSYVIQIDSLNSLNEKLVEENRTVTRKYEEATQTATQLQKDKEQLSQKVTIASKLDAVGITVTPVSNRGKAVTKIG
ncbi:MAG: hypothetical protein J1E02_04195, partial [Coprobacter sp.]|nr:hypothetical protein [Coprobacter sp.]